MLYNGVELTKTNDKYVLRTFGKLTGSKIKYFLKRGAEAYYLKYEMCVNPPDFEEEKEPRYFVVGHAFDYMLQVGPEKRKEKYWIDEGMLVAELRETLLGKYPEEELKSMKKEELLEVYGNGRIRLTKAEGRDIIGMYREAMRQPDYDMGGNYDRQYEITAEYEGFTLGGTLDRFSKEKQLIRDDKTTGQFDFFEYNLETKLGYLTSMSFYYLLALVSEGVSCDVILDVLGKKKPYGYLPYRLTKDQLREQIQEKIKPGILALKECYETNVWESVYPIDYYSEDKYGNITTRKAGEKIPRTVLMGNEYYPVLNGTISSGEFVEPIIY